MRGRTSATQVPQRPAAQTELPGAQDRLKDYQGASARLQVEFVDPIARPAVARDYDIRFKRSLGPVVEVEFLPLNWLGIKLRAVFERYKPRDGGPAAEGNHVGVFANFYF